MRCEISRTALRIIVFAYEFSLAYETSKKNRPLFKRIIVRYVVKFHSNFRANFHRKVAETKNELRAFRLHYFCTILYTQSRIESLYDQDFRPAKIFKELSKD